MSLLLNGTTKAKVDCAKECPCGVPVIPVPDQWLEVVVTGGFKVWHIIFIIIAFIITIIVVYCCFHRCRIPRTKQEIEADLMRTNITNKFRDYVTEFPNEPMNFIEALKRVQELEERSEKDDAFAREASARKRRGWLKLKGPKNDEKEPEDKSNDQKQQVVQDKQVDVATEKIQKRTGAERQLTTETSKVLANEQPPTQLSKVENLTTETKEELDKPPLTVKNSRTRIKRSSKDGTDLSTVQPPASGPVLVAENIPKTVEPVTAESEQKNRPVKRRRHKPNLSRTRRTGELDIEKGVNFETSEAPMQANTTRHQHASRVKIEPDVKANIRHSNSDNKEERP